MQLYFDKLGNPLTLEEFVLLFEDRDYCIIKQTRHKEKGKEFWLSTVWVGINHQFGNGPPLIFETMALRYKPKFTDVIASDEDWEWQERYTTEDEALAARDPWRVVTVYRPDMLAVALNNLKALLGGEER
jgi:hypothetical protein